MPAISSSVSSQDTSSAVSSLKALKQSRIVPLPTAASDEACCICLNAYSPSHKAVTVLIKDCYHRFGQGCLDAYLDSDSPGCNTCPQCRQEWYKRRPIVTKTRVTVTSLPQAPVRVESRTRSRRAQRMLGHEHSSSEEIIATHLDAIFRLLDLVQNISNEQTTMTADTRVRLQAVERRARRIHQEPHTADDAATSAMRGMALRGYEMRQQPGTMSQRDIMSQRGWMAAFAVNLGNDSYPTANEVDRISTTTQDGNVIRGESCTSFGVSSPNELNIHPLLRSGPREELNETWGVSVQPMKSHYHLDASLGMFPQRLTESSSRRGTTAISQSHPRAVIAPSPRVSVAAPDPTDSDMNSNADNHTSSQRLSQKRGDVARNPRGYGLYFRRQPVSESQMSLQNHALVPTSNAEQRLRPVEQGQVSFTVQPEDHVIRTPLSAPPRLLQRRSSLGNLRDHPALHSSPAANSRPSMSGLERIHSIRDARHNLASQGWRESLPRRFSLASWKGSLLSKRGLGDGLMREPSGQASYMGE